MAGTLYGGVGTTCTQRVFVVAYELGLDLTLSPVNIFAGDHKKEPYISRHPFGKVPAYESPEGLKFFESRAIARYLDAKNGGKLTYINNLSRYALVETWISVESHNFEKFASTLVAELLFKKMFFKQDPDQDEVAKNKTALIAVLDVYEKELSTRKFLAGDDYTIADLFHLPTGSHLFAVLPELYEGRPHLKQWFETISALPSWQKTLQNISLPK